MANKYQGYPEYKKSGVNWLGDIPTSWDVLPIKILAKIFNGATPKSGDKLFWDGDISWITPADLGKKTSPYISKGSRSITVEGYDLCGTSLVPKDSVILSSRAPIGTLGIASNDLCTNQGCKSLVLKNSYVPRFLYYVLLSSTEQLNLLGRGTTFLEISSDALGSYKVGSPSELEQDKIANFLDHETTKIDTLIDKQQQLISLLKEKCQAVISHAVTKGLNPNAPMRDSDVEWLGEVPEHWIPMQIRRILTNMEQGKSPECESREAENHEWGVLKTSCVNRAIYNSKANKALPDIIKPFPQYEVKKGDVLMSRASGSRDLIGSVAYVYETRPRILLSDKVFRLHLSSRVNRIFFSFLMQSSYMRSNIERAISGAEGMANNITKSAVIGFIFALPPENEQYDIAEIVTKNLSVFDELIVKAHTAIGLMQERRTALISAAVTGKIDVRNWVSPEPSENQNKVVAV